MGSQHSSQQQAPHVLPVPRATFSSHQANNDCNSGPTETQHGTTFTPSAYLEA